MESLLFLFVWFIFGFLCVMDAPLWPNATGFACIKILYPKDGRVFKWFVRKME